MAKIKEQLAKILTANNLMDGSTVYYTASGTWSPHAADSLVASSSESIDKLSKAATDALAANLVISEEIVDIDPGDGVQPHRLRELIRATGPTVRRDLNKSISSNK